MSEQEVVRERQRRRFYLLIGVLGMLVIWALVSRARSGSRESVYMASAQSRRTELGATGASADYAAYGGGGARMARGMVRTEVTGKASEAVPGGEQTGLEPTSRVSPWPVSPMLVRTAGVRMRVDNVPTAHAAIASIARGVGGYVAAATLSAEEGPASAHITIRVPNDGMDSVIDQIAGLGTLLSKEISAQEVTEEYVDLSSRKRNLEREELRLLDLLQRAGKIRDLLEVEQEVGRIRGEVETIAGRMRYLENRVALSTVNVQLNGPEPAPKAGSEWTAKDVFRQAGRSLINTGRGLATHLIWIGVFTPVWLPLALLGALGIRWGIRTLPKA